MMRPLVTRAKNRGALEVASILATFGLSFVMVGLMLWAFGGNFFNYAYLAVPAELFGSNYAQNRIVAFLLAALIAAALWLWLSYSRTGLTLRAVSVNPASARLVGIDVRAASALAFALGGAVTAAGGR